MYKVRPIDLNLLKSF